jgi:hypothetical protein
MLYVSSGPKPEDVTWWRRPSGKRRNLSTHRFYVCNLSHPVEQVVAFDHRGIDTDAPLLEASYRGAVGLGRKMSKHTVRAACGGVLVGFSVLALGFPASAAPFNLPDNYYGGLNTYNNNPPTTGDVIGDSTFYITSADVSRAGDTLSIVINTNFAGAPGTSPADGTGYGSLFLSPGTWTPSGTSPYPTDKYTANEWQYAVTIPQNPGSGSIGTTSSGLYAIGGGATANLYPANTSVVQSYTTANGTVVMSNVNGDPVTYPGTAQPGYYFREGQAVRYTPGNGPIASTSATWAVNALLNTITFTIVDPTNIFGNSFALAWAMTCANDVIQGQVTLSPGHGESFSPTPLPAAFPLFAGGLGMIALLSRKRKKQIANLAA